MTLARGTVLVFLGVGVALLSWATPLGALVRELAGTLAAHDSPADLALFVTAYALAIAAGVPGTVFTVIGGVGFGLWPGLPLNLLGAAAGAMLGFWVGRGLGRGLLSGRLEPLAVRLGPLERPRTAFWVFMVLRAVPLFPFNAVNFAAGLTRARLPPYVLGTTLGIVPSTVAWTWFAQELQRGDATAAGLRLAAFLAVATLAALSLRRRWPPRDRPASGNHHS